VEVDVDVVREIVRLRDSVLGEVFEDMCGDVLALLFGTW
jgi:hypothetical protein